MDSHLLTDRTAHWQARVEHRTAYEEEAEAEDIGVRDARVAYTEWALALLRAHTLELHIHKAEAHIKRAIAATQLSAKRPETKRQPRERLRQLRTRLRELKSGVGAAKAAVKEAQDNYEYELDWLEEYGS